MNQYKNFNPEQYTAQISLILAEILNTSAWDDNKLRQILTSHPKDSSSLFSKDQLLAGYRLLTKKGLLEKDSELESRLQTKPSRTQSGVTIVSVLTKPYPCPGSCIFCPNDKDMPKSYLSDEPGAQRAKANEFHPYLQIYNRLKALHAIGHNTEKIELIILGGTWSSYDQNYQRWFIKECFRALNEFDPVHIDNSADNDAAGESLAVAEAKTTYEDIAAQHRQNENAHARCVGLSVETRPDCITKEEIIRLRQYGVTKVQIGIQSLDDEVLHKNNRQHTSRQSSDAFALLRLSGLKIHAHWMFNLYGVSPEMDISGYAQLWKKAFRPDEVKLYPTSIIKGTVLHRLYTKGTYRPYTQDELMHVLTGAMSMTPRYCRITRVIRDISSDDIVSGNKLTNFRQLAEQQLRKTGSPCQCIRCREIRGQSIDPTNLTDEIITYQTSIGTEHFISIVDSATDTIAGFLRLSLPEAKHFQSFPFNEIHEHAMVREVHVYGNVVGISARKTNAAQHTGIGTRLIALAENTAKRAGYTKISVISGIGTRGYYRNRSFTQNKTYMSKDLH